MLIHYKTSTKLQMLYKRVKEVNINENTQYDNDSLAETY